MSEETTEMNESTNTEQAVNTENAEPSTETKEKTFTQAELDEIIQKRLERDRETVSRKAAQEARDALIAEEGYTHNGKPITTEAEYREALKEQELREKYKELPEDVQKELIESKKFRETYTKQQNISAEKAKQEADYRAFLETFPTVKSEDIPESVWDEFNKGKSLVDAYTRHENQSLKEQLAKLAKTDNIEQQNAENADSSTGSVKGQGEAKPVRFTRAQVEKMSQAETNKNWKAIQESMKVWE